MEEARQFPYRLKSVRVSLPKRMKKIQEPSSKFVKVRCPKCKNEQIIFGKASTEVRCLVCDKVLAEPIGGKSKIKSRILEVLE